MESTYAYLKHHGLLQRISKMCHTLIQSISLKMANIIPEKFLMWAEVSKHHRVYKSEKITTSFLTQKSRRPCSYVKITAALYQPTSLFSGKYFLYLIVSLQFVKFLSDTSFMVRLCFSTYLCISNCTRCFLLRYCLSFV
jgi:hypothetical protein